MGMATMFWVQFFLVLGAILLGIRKGGVALGLIGGLGVAVLVFLFRVAPSEPPVAVMLIILAVVTAAATGLAVMPICEATLAIAIGRSGRVFVRTATSEMTGRSA